MDAKDPSSDDRRSEEQLNPLLREAVARIRDSEPPDDVLSRSLDLAKRRLSDTVPSAVVQRRFELHTVWLVAVAVAASILVAVVFWQFYPRRDGQPEIAREPKVDAIRRSVTDKIRQLDAALDTPPPTLWAYHQTASQSLEELSELLTAHARQFRVSGPVVSVSLSDSPEETM